MHDIEEKILSVMTEISGYVDVESNDGSSFDIEAAVQRSKSRRLTDLTDKLWDILKCKYIYKFSTFYYQLSFASEFFPTLIIYI